MLLPLRLPHVVQSTQQPSQHGGRGMSPMLHSAVALASLGAALARAGSPLPEAARLPLSLDELHARPGGSSWDTACPCEPATLCEPIKVSHPKEVFGFTAGTMEQAKAMDWAQVTTVAWSTDPQMVCLAHKNNARLVARAPLGNITALGTDAAARAAWVAKVVAMVQTLHIDGVTFDYESPIANGAPEAEMYVQIIAETTAALHEWKATTQTSVCVAWSPNHIDGRFYDIPGFAKAADLLYIMMYDTRSQIFDACIAGPNAGLPIAILGAQQYLDVGVPASQLILGVPWYGYSYPCLPGTAPDARFCPIKEVPFRGVNCSDAAGSEMGFSKIMVRPPLQPFSRAFPVPRAPARSLGLTLAVCVRRQWRMPGRQRRV